VLKPMQWPPGEKSTMYRPHPLSISRSNRIRSAGLKAKKRGPWWEAEERRMNRIFAVFAFATCGRRYMQLVAFVRP
jgi:hypothetical protein